MAYVLVLFLCIVQLISCDVNNEQEKFKPSELHTVLNTEETEHHFSRENDKILNTEEPTPNVDDSEPMINKDSTGDKKVSEEVVSDISLTDNDDNNNIAMNSDNLEPIVLENEKNNPKVFSLTNFIKSWLNPVLQEFQEGLHVVKDKNETAISNNNRMESTGSLNNTESYDLKNITDTGKRVKFNCTGRNMTENTTAGVRLVNSSVLLDFLSFDKTNQSTDCVLIMFYAPWCKFCAGTAAQFNAVGRAFIQLDVLAVDAVHFSNLNARFGTVAVPNIMVFHNSRSAIRFNHTDRMFEKLVEFVTNVTGLEPNTSILVEEMDYIGPLSSTPAVESDYLLWCAWIFVLLCTGHMFVNSRYGQGAIEKVRTLWQEHQHIE